MSFLITHTLSGWSMLVGAIGAGILTSFLIQKLQAANIQEDAAIGLIFTTLFAVGVLLVTLYAGNIHLDIEHILMGEIAFVPWDTWTIMTITMPKAVWMLSFVLIIDIIFLLSCFKLLKLSTFDPVYAASIGLPLIFLQYSFMTMISLTTVSAFDSVGAILVVAMLITPAATAYLISRSVSQMIVYSVLFGVLSAVIGYYVAKWLNTSISGMMAVTLGIQFIVILLSQKAFEWRQKRNVV
ncbi:MAG: metal ABC transporter permease, partial [Lysinibacillus sp.]